MGIMHLYLCMAQDIQHEEVKDNFKSRRPLTSKIEVTIEQVKKLVSEDHWLSEWLQVRWTWKKDSVWKIITKDLESLCKNGAKTAKWWSVIVPHTRVSGHHWVSSKWTRFASSGYHWWWDMNFLLWPGNQVPEQSVEVSDVAKADESKTVSHVDHVLWCKRHLPEWVLTTGSENQSASLLGDPAVYALLYVWGEKIVVAGQIVAASP